MIVLGFAEAQAKNNAILASRAAVDVESTGREDAAERGIQNAGFIGNQRVALAAAGVTAESRSGNALIRDATESSKVEQLRILNNARREALGLRAQENQFLSQAAGHKAARKGIKRALPFALAGTALTGIGTGIGAGIFGPSKGPTPILGPLE